MSTPAELETINRELGADPEGLVRWASGLGQKMIATTNFGPFSAVVLHLVTRIEADIPVLWIDSGYGTEAMYRYADELTRRLRLNLHIYHPRRSRAHREAIDGPVPSIDDPRHAEFTREVKLEPFDAALRDLAPGVWFAGIRKDQTDFRAGLAPVTWLAGENRAGENRYKVAPVFHWNARQMNDYLKTHGLPNNFDYYDPTKVEDKRECGLHLAY